MMEKSFIEILFHAMLSFEVTQNFTFAWSVMPVDVICKNIYISADMLLMVKKRNKKAI